MSCSRSGDWFIGWLVDFKMVTVHGTLKSLYFDLFSLSFSQLKAIFFCHNHFVFVFLASLPPPIPRPLLLEVRAVANSDYNLTLETVQADCHWHWLLL